MTEHTITIAACFADRSATSEAVPRCRGQKAIAENKMSAVQRKQRSEVACGRELVVHGMVVFPGFFESNIYI